MSTLSERNQFRRYIGDFGTSAVDDATIKSYFDDAVRELTADFVDVNNLSAPVTDFDVLVPQYHPEVIVKAAINWWWQKAARLADHHTQTVGQSSQNASEKWDRAMEMIRHLEELYATIQALGTDITFGNISRFSKATLTRIGGQREETAYNAP